MSGKEKETAMLLVLDGERLVALESAYDFLCGILEKAEQEPPTFEDFLKDCTMVGVMQIMNQVQGAVQTAQLLSFMRSLDKR